MKFVILELDKNYGDYSYKSASDAKMNILGDFFSDLGHSPESINFFERWPFDDSQSDGIGTNITFLEKNNNFIYLMSKIPGDNDDTTLVFSYQQFSQLMGDWQEQVCKYKPKEVTIMYDKDQFIIETKNIETKN